ncbi:Protein NLRC5 [Labeo rohita]|uniref:Protein NLRC5 n=1 Tax=Labeo rohita TaxID=84645 RepID=A0ABQ8LS85_LABRO|nr:Protein NLRC5 [Labeo rohita]
MERMDWPVDVRTQVDQAGSELVELLCRQNSDVLDRIFALVEPKRLDQIQSLTNNRDRVSAIVEYFRNSDRNLCTQFLSTVYQYSENIPFLLETTLVSIAGYTHGANCNHTCETDQSSPSPHVKRPRLDHLQSYTDALKDMVLQKHKSVAQAVVKDIRLDDTWVYLRHRNLPRGKDRNIQPQASLDNHEGEESEHKVSVESLLKTTSRVVMLLGQAGSGKTLLVHCLGRSWAEGSFPSIDLLFLLEFRQLNLISRNLSLKELLFLYYPACGDDKEQSDAVFEFILSKPEKVCFIIDGYDEFRAKLTHPERLESNIDPSKLLPMTDLLSGLCNRKFLQGCTVLVTCRPRDVTDMFGSPGFITCELQGFDRLGVKEYAEQYFHKKGDELKKKAVNLLMDNRHLLSMSHIPGLCHICCVCMDHLFSSDGTHLQLPTSLTQIYMQILLAFLKRIDEGVVSGTSPLQRHRTKIDEMSQLALKGLDESTIVFMDTDVSPELQNFGIKSGILSCVKLTFEDGSSGRGFTFMHLTMQEFLAALHLMTSQSITESQLKKKLNLKTRWTTKIDPKTVFTDSLHLYVCGLAAEACTYSLIQLKGAESTKAWVQKRQAAVRNVLLGFSGSTSQTGPKIVELCRCAYETRDAKLARAIGSRPQFEMRNIRLNTVDMDSLAFVTAAADQNVCLDFGGCSIDLDCLEILPSFKTVDHLIFRSRKYDDKFAEALCGILCKLQALRQLDFISGGLTDVGAAKLARALEDCPNITHLKMGKNSISTDGIITLIERMAACPSVQEVRVEANKEISLFFSQSSDTVCENTDLNNKEEPKSVTIKQSNINVSNVVSLCNKLRGFSHITLLDLSKNSLGNKGLKKILDLLPKLGMIQEIKVGENGVDMDGVVMLASALCNQKNLKRVDASENGKKQLALWFDTSRRLTHSDIKPVYMTKLCKQLVKCENLLDIEFSHLKLSNESVEKLMLILPEMSSLQLLNLSHVDLSTNGALLLVRSLADCQRVTAVELRLTEYKLCKSSVEKLSKILENCPRLSELDLSHNLLRDDGVKCFVDYLPKLKISSSVSLTGNRITQIGALHLVNSMNTCEKVVAVEVSLGVEDQSLIKFVQEHVNGKTLRLRDCSFEVIHLKKLVEILNRCPRLLTLELSSNSLQSQGLLLDSLVELSTIQTVKLGNNCLSSEQIEYFVKQFGSCHQPRDIRIEEPWLTGSAVVSLVAKCLTLQPHIKEIRAHSEKFSPALQSISLDLKGAAEDEVETLAEALPDTTTFESLGLSQLVLSDRGAAVLGRALQSVPNLELINLSQCSGWTEARGRDLVRGLMQCLSLAEIRLDSVVLDEEGVTILAQGFSRLTSLRRLRLSKNQLGLSSAAKLAQVLPLLPQLSELNLSENQLGPQGSLALCDGLMSMKALKILHSDLVGVASSLKNCPSIEDISLSWNGCSDSLAQTLAEILPLCTKLRRLDLEANNISTAGATVIAKCLPLCPFIEVIRLWRNPIAKDDENLKDQRLNFSSV